MSWTTRQRNSIERCRNCTAKAATATAKDLSENHDDSFMSSLSATEPRRHTGREPPVDLLNAEKPDVLLDDWLPLRIRASSQMEWVDTGRMLATVCRTPLR